MKEKRTYYGKYRATVITSEDPESRGRILATLVDADVKGILSTTTWALPSLPIAMVQMGIFSPPPLGTLVWIEFERGDPDHPIWSGCYWGSALEVPALARLVPPGVPHITMQTPLQSGILISDLPPPTGGIMLRCGPSTLIIGQDGIKIIAPKIEINGVTIINQGALMIT